MQLIRTAIAFLLPLVVLPLRAVETDQNTRVEQILPRLQRIADTLRRQEHIPGVAIAIVTPDRVYFLNSGVRSTSAPDKIDANTVFQIASVSKPVTGTYVARLVTENRLQWNTRIVSQLPWFRFGSDAVTRRVTVLDMLTQRSGLVGGGGNILEDFGWGQRYVLDKMRYIDPAAGFRKTWDYANFGITLGGVAAARTTRLEFPASIQRTLFEPLGMSRSNASYAKFLRYPNRAEMTYVIDGKARPLFVRDAQSQAPGGGVNSTSRDLARLLQVYLNGGRHRGQQFLSPSAMALATSPLTHVGKFADGAEHYYGVGWDVKIPQSGPRTILHTGAFAGVRTILSFRPEQRIGVVVLANSFFNQVPEAIEDVFYQLYNTGRVKRHTLKNWRTLAPFLKTLLQTIDDVVTAPVTLPANVLGQPRSTYAGTYANDYFGRMTIAQTASGLALSGGQDQTAMPLRLVGEKLYVINKSGDPFALLFSGFDGAKFAALTIDDPTVVAIGWSVLERVP